MLQMHLFPSLEGFTGVWLTCFICTGDCHIILNFESDVLKSKRDIKKKTFLAFL